MLSKRIFINSKLKPFLVHLGKPSKQEFHKCFQQEDNWSWQAGDMFWTEILYNEKFSSRWSNQKGEIILTAGQFAWCRTLNKTLSFWTIVVILGLTWQVLVEKYRKV